ncbi:Rv2578c family radical SAM protein [Amycolatopsis magusensis]|uniref:Rv2578c family radical SAM protein n=1 Tax=Amycolatopsis magusensis TaxID=882444 RepID=UPI003C2C9794
MCSTLGVRWDRQRVGDEGEQSIPGMGLAGLVRSVTSPEFAGVTFHEVRARSVLNKVPGSSAVPFSWTVNPYRGCSHACTYCLAGDTEVLMADGDLKPLEEIEVGDEVFGTRSYQGYRRGAPTRVLAHWATVKRAYRVVLENGVELIASGDHRFLTERGWRHVLADRPGPAARPHLAVGEQLVGISLYTTELPARLGVARVEDLGREIPMYDLTTESGDFIANGVVSHNCFARKTHTYLDFDAGKDFDSQVVVKVNAPEVLATQLRKPGWTREHVAMGTNTDPYQRAEGRYRLMPGIISALADSGTPFSILTKGTVLTRDLPLLSSVSTEVPVGLSVSIALLDRDLQQRLEPGTPSPQARLELVRRIRDAGLPCGVLVAPILPGLTDSDEALDSLLAEIAAAGATSVTSIALHLRPGAREWFARWLAVEYPALVPLYRELYGRGSYAKSFYRKQLSARFATLMRRHGLDSNVFRTTTVEQVDALPAQRRDSTVPRQEPLFPL